MKRLFNTLVRFFASLSVVVLLAYAFIHIAPGDPVSRMIDASFETSADGAISTQDLRLEWRHRLGMDLPLFYFSMNSQAENGLGYWIPACHFNSANQFHRWLFGDGLLSHGVLRGDLGISYATRQPVSQVLKGRISWSVTLVLISMLFALTISVPVALYATRKRGQPIDRIIRSISFGVISLPVFWIAVVLLTLFANPDVLNWLPASGTGPLYIDPASTRWTIICEKIPYLILPLFCYTIGTTAFLIQSIRESAAAELQSDYARTALAKGQSEKKVLYTHVLRNLLPSLLTLCSFAFPAAISGAVIIEYIFGLPGMGSLLHEATINRDYPVLSAVFLISAILTLIGFALADWGASRLDPRRLEGGKS